MADPRRNWRNRPHRCQRCGLWSPHKFGLHRALTPTAGGLCTGKVRPVRG